jgi:hypothetical protein
MSGRMVRPTTRKGASNGSHDTTTPVNVRPAGPARLRRRDGAGHGLTDFKATQVKVDACSALIAQGWVGPQQVLRKSRPTLFPAQTVLQHRDGLVVFA